MAWYDDATAAGADITGAEWNTLVAFLRKSANGLIQPTSLGTGTASSTTFLRGDNSWQTVTSGASEHSSLTGLAWANSGHTGALPSANGGTGVVNANKITISTAAPGSPATGDIWIDIS